MISGFFSCGNVANDKPYVVISCFSESYNISPFPSSEQSSTLNINDQFKHLYSEELAVGVVAGGLNDKCIFMSHLTCTGYQCPCSQFALNFLERRTFHDLSEECVENLKEVLQQSVSPPFMAIVVINGQSLCFSGFNEYDADSFILPKPSCNIQDCFLQIGNAVTAQNEGYIHSWLHDDVDALKVSQQMTDALYGEIEYWPKPSGMGLTLMSYDGQIVVQLTNPAEQHAVSPLLEIPKPKGPITAFNFYSKIARRVVLDEHGSSITNNELNRLLGLRWKDMDEEQRMPYHHQAEMDRKRYNMDLLAYQTLLKKMQQINQTTTNDGITKPITAYNHFVHQEKQYIMGLNLVDAQTRMGKHGGDRWTDMNKAERELYQVLRDAEAELAL